MALWTRVSLVVADTIVTAATWFRMYGHVKEAFDSNLPRTISTVMLADGAWVCVGPHMGGVWFTIYQEAYTSCKYFFPWSLAVIAIDVIDLQCIARVQCLTVDTRC